MKIGIYTIHSAYNYGAMLQAYATQKTLEKLGHQVEFVNLYPLELEKKNESKIISWNLKLFIIYIYSCLNPKVRSKHKKFRKFRSLMNMSKRYYSLDEIYDNPPKYDIHLVGSDQVWNLEKGFQEKNFFFLDFLTENETKISYASSFGTSTISTNCNDKLFEFLKGFKAISTREREGVGIIKRATGLDSKHVLDPTFLLTCDEWNSFSIEPEIKGDYILCYGFDGSEKSKEMIFSVKKRLNIPVIVISVSLFFPFKLDRFIHEVGPSEFLGLVKNAKFICTSSYHGMALAINYRKSFIGTLHPTRNARMKSMLSKFDLEKRQLNNPKEILNMADDELYIDYSKIDSKITKAIKDSYMWLNSNLEVIESEKTKLL